MHALQEELLGVSAQVEDALHPQNVFAEFGDQRTEPDAQLHGIQHAGLHDAGRLDVLQVIVTLVVVMAAMSMMMIVSLITVLMRMV